MKHASVPEIRIRSQNAACVRADGGFVLYWMIANRRLTFNFSLQRAVEWAVKLKKPLLIFEPLRVGYPWASDRLHRFIVDGMADNAAHIAAANIPGVLYYPYVEATAFAGKELLARLMRQACVVVTDDFPCFFLPRLVATVATKANVLVEAVDSNGLLPLRATERVFTTAFSFRAFLQKELPQHLNSFPFENPLKGIKLPPMPVLKAEITTRWPLMNSQQLSSLNLASLPIDHSVGVVRQRGGTTVARERLSAFITQLLPRYAENANEPDDDVRSCLSPYLHFGHISAHEMFHSLMSHQEWSANMLGRDTSGKREGWWGVSPAAESWLDEFVTWREIGYNMTSHREDYDQYESLPDWARATLEKHSRDKRVTLYSLEQFAAAETHDALWNAAQRQLVREGRIHNYLRMLWGKKILEWTAHPREALAIMIELNNKYALDGRNPNSYSGIFWVLGRYDRAWGPERSIFGTVRYMSSESTRKKLRVREYLKKYAAHETVKELF